MTIMNVIFINIGGNFPHNFYNQCVIFFYANENKSIIFPIDIISGNFYFYLTTVMAAVPTVLTNDATDIDTSSAKLHGDHTDNGGRNTGFEWFEYGTTIGYGGETTHILVFVRRGRLDYLKLLFQNWNKEQYITSEHVQKTWMGYHMAQIKTFVTIGENNKPNITCVYPANNSIDLDRSLNVMFVSMTQI